MNDTKNKRTDYIAAIIVGIVLLFVVWPIGLFLILYFRHKLKKLKTV